MLAKKKKKKKKKCEKCTRRIFINDCQLCRLFLFKFDFKQPLNNKKKENTEKFQNGYLPSPNGSLSIATGTLLAYLKPAITDILSVCQKKLKVKKSQKKMFKGKENS